jgi:hypothetical protein
LGFEMRIWSVWWAQLAQHSDTKVDFLNSEHRGPCTFAKEERGLNQQPFRSGKIVRDAAIRILSKVTLGFLPGNLITPSTFS